MSRGARRLHLVVDGAGHDVARGEGAARVVALHERRAVARHQDGPLAAHRLADEEPLGLRMEETGGVELHHLHVADLRARAPRHGDAVASGDVGVAGVLVDLADAAGGEDDRARAHGPDLAGLRAQQIGADHAVLAALVQKARGHQIDQQRVLADMQPLGRAHARRERPLHLAPRDVAGMEDPPPRVPPLARQVITLRAGRALALGERHAHLDEAAETGGAGLDDAPHHVLMAQPGPRVKRVGHVQVKRVVRAHHARNAALGIGGVRLVQRPLRHQQHAPMPRQPHRGHRPGDAAADDQVIAVNRSHANPPNGRRGACTPNSNKRS